MVVISRSGAGEENRCSRERERERERERGGEGNRMRRLWARGRTGQREKRKIRGRV